MGCRLSNKDRRQRGYTALELTVVVAIAGIALVGSTQLFATSNEMTATTRLDLRVESENRRNLQAVINRLRSSDVSTWSGLDPSGRATRPCYSIVSGVDEESRTTSRTECLEWRAVSRDVDGIESPGEVYAVWDGGSELVADRVPEGGFSVTLDGRRIVVDLETYYVTSRGEVKSVARQAAVYSRN